MPQHDGLDDTLTVREHLLTYARVNGVPRREVKRNVEAAIALTDLEKYRDRKAGALSGGNRRKLSLGLALMGNPSIYMLDELGSGVDAMTKRVLWKTLRKVGRGRAILMTTHSMEEVDALADRLAIQAGRFLAVGTIDELRKSRPCYEIQLSTRPLDGVTRLEQAQRVRDFVLRNLPTATESDSASARFEVPLRSYTTTSGDGSSSASSQSSADYSEGTSVAQIYRRLHSDTTGRQHAGIVDFVAQPISLEGLFMHVVRDANVMGEDEHSNTK